MDDPGSAIESSFDGFEDNPANQATKRALSTDKVRMSDSVKVQERLAPLMERLKSSLAKIHSLEESLARMDASTVNLRGESIPEGGIPNNTNIQPGSLQSREILRSRMGRLKKKLITLKHLEDGLTDAEDRRQNLQHLFLQTSLSKPALEAASMKRRTREIEDKVEYFENECRRLADENNDAKKDAEERLETLNEKFERLQLQMQENEDTIRAKEKDIVELSLRCEDLECQLDHLTKVRENLWIQLQQESSAVDIGNGDHRQPNSHLKAVLPANSLAVAEIGSNATVDTEENSASSQSMSYDSDCEGISTKTTGASNNVLNLGLLKDILRDSGSGKKELIRKMAERIEQLEIENSKLRGSDHVVDIDAVQVSDCTGTKSSRWGLGFLRTARKQSSQ